MENIVYVIIAEPDRTVRFYAECRVGRIFSMLEQWCVRNPRNVKRDLMSLAVQRHCGSGLVDRGSGPWFFRDGKAQPISE